jgi:two-component system OmpR family sensor kinase
VRSIRRQLIVALVGAVSLALLGVGFAIYRTAQEETGALFDYHLRQIALSLREASFSGSWMPPPEVDTENFDFVVQVWDASGVRLYYSNPHRELPGFVAGGYADVDTREGRWRVFAIRSRSQVIQVAQPLGVRNRMALEAALHVLLPLLLLLPLLGAVIWMIVTRGLAPLNRLARAVASRTPALLAPLPEHQAPDEVRPLVQSLNDLLQRLAEALAAQQAFIADAAHELRTPIAALQLQAQLAERAETDAEQQVALDDLKAGIRRAGRTVQQLLTLARQEPGLAAKPCEPVALADVAREVLAEQSPLARAKSIDLGLAAADEGAVVHGDPDALHVLMTNLVENALRYTPAGGRVDVSVRRDDGAPRLEVRDTGPGIPAEDLPRIFDRFYRGGHTTEPGTGLGLAIVKAIADRHAARVEVGNGEGGGLRVGVGFPLSESAAALLKPRDSR